MNELTKIEAAEAHKQGWLLTTVYDTRGYFTAGIVPAEGSKLDSAQAALRFVWQRARTGDIVCRRALSIVSAAELAARGSKKAKKK